SSVERTYSSSRRRRPCQWRWYKSRITPAFAANCGSRGKIRQRCRHGRIASADNQRQTVVPLICATSPCLTASRAISLPESRARGKPSRVGSSQARALTCTTSSGGKGRRAPTPCPIGQTGCALVKVTLPPLRDDLTWQAKSRSDLTVGVAVAGQQDNLRPHDLLIRGGVFASEMFQRCSFGIVQLDFVGAHSRHTHAPCSEYATPNLQRADKYVTVFMKRSTKDNMSKPSFVTKPLPRVPLPCWKAGQHTRPAGNSQHPAERSSLM